MRYLLITVMFIISTALFCAETVTVAVVPFSRGSGVYQNITDSIQYKVEHFLVKNGVDLVSRNRIKQILEEQKLSLSGLLDSSKAVELGKIASAEKLITGYVEKRGRKYFILAQKIDVKSGKIENSVYTETSSNDMFFTQSIKAMVKELTEDNSIKNGNNKSISMKKEEKRAVLEDNVTKTKIEKDNEVIIDQKSIKVNKISFDYLEKDRFIGQFYVIAEDGTVSFLKGELYVENEVFDIYKKEGEKYPSITEDIMSIIPDENSVVTINGEKSRIKQDLTTLCIKDNEKKYIIENSSQVIYANRVDDMESYFKDKRIKIPQDDYNNQKDELENFFYNIKSSQQTDAILGLKIPDKLNVSAINFEGIVDITDIAYIIPANYKIGLKNGFVIKYFDPEILKMDFDYLNKDKFEILCMKNMKDECIKLLKSSFGSRIPEDPYFIENIKEPAIKKYFEDYDDRRWKIPRETNISLDYKTIKDIEDLKGVYSLRYLSLRHNNIEELKPIENLKNLISIDLSDNKIKSFDSFEKLKRLQILDISNNQLQELDGIEKVWWLRELSAGYNRIFDISCLEKMSGLKNLYLEKTRIEDITPISKLTNLERLNLNYNQLFYNTEPLSKLKKLKSIHIMETSVQDISVFIELKNLERVNIAKTEIKDIEPIKKLKFLNWLNLSSTDLNSSSFEEWSFNGNLEIKDEEQYNTITIKKEEKSKYGIKDGKLVYSYQ